MQKEFRSELFTLCKWALKDECAGKIKELIHNMSSCQVENNINTKPDYGDFKQIAQYSNNEFWGYLFLDENIEAYSKQKFYRVTKLLPEDRILIERGHRTLTRFVELCLSEIANRSSLVAASMNPYFMYKTVTVSSEADSLLSDEELQTVVEAFKHGRVYQTLMKTDMLNLFNQLDTKQMRLLIGGIEKEMNQSLGGNTTNELKDFSMKILGGVKDINSVLFALSVLIYAIKSSLMLACKVLYNAMCGNKLFVLDNNNIISIDKNHSTDIGHFYRVVSIDLDMDFLAGERGGILLIDCDVPFGRHIHEFGMLVAQTYNLAGEFGQSAKYSFVTVNEEMIYIQNMTDNILRNMIF